MSRLLADLTPLRESRQFRLLFFGQMVSWMGRQLTYVAVPYQVYELTHSSLAVGMVGLAALGPLIVFSLIGGAIADAMDRRRLLIITQLLMVAMSVGLAVNAHQEKPALWPLYVLSALIAGLGGVEHPTRSAVMPKLVRRELFPAAAALNQIVMQVGLVVGPSIAGLLISRVSVASAYWIDAATFGVIIAMLLRMDPLPPEGGGTPAGLASIREGIAYLRGQRLLVSTFVIDLDAMIFGMPRALFPALAATVFGGGAATLGLLYAAPGAGALAGAVFTGWVTRVRRQGLAVVLAVLAWGAAIAAFGLVSWLPLALVLLALAGGADVISAVFRNTILQLSVPDSLRGRLTAVHIAVVTGGPRLGDAEAGAVAALTTPRISVVSGGVACIVGVAAVVRWAPELLKYDRDAAPSAAPAAEGGPLG